MEVAKIFEQFVEDAENPDWKEFDNHLGRHVHDWRSYITEEVRENWEQLSLIARCAVISCCEEVAGNEEWD